MLPASANSKVVEERVVEAAAPMFKVLYMWVCGFKVSVIHHFNALIAHKIVLKPESYLKH